MQGIEVSNLITFTVCQGNTSSLGKLHLTWRVLTIFMPSIINVVVIAVKQGLTKDLFLDTCPMVRRILDRHISLINSNGAWNNSAFRQSLVVFIQAFFFHLPSPLQSRESPIHPSERRWGGLSAPECSATASRIHFRLDLYIG